MPRPAPVAANVEYETVLADEQLDAWLAKIERGARSTSIDTETTVARSDARRGSSASRLSVEPGHACYIPLAHRYAGAPDQLPLRRRARPAAALARKPAPAQRSASNIKYDTHVLANHGIALRGIAHDTLLQ